MDNSKVIAKELKLIRKELEKANRYTRVNLFTKDENILTEAFKMEDEFHRSRVKENG